MKTNGTSLTTEEIRNFERLVIKQQAHFSTPPATALAMLPADGITVTGLLWRPEGQQAVILRGHFSWLLHLLRAPSRMVLASVDILTGYRSKRAEAGLAWRPVPPFTGGPQSAAPQGRLEHSAQNDFRYRFLSEARSLQPAQLLELKRLIIADIARLTGQRPQTVFTRPAKPRVPIQQVDHAFRALIDAAAADLLQGSRHK